MTKREGDQNVAGQHVLHVNGKPEQSGSHKQSYIQKRTIAGERPRHHFVNLSSEKKTKQDKPGRPPFRKMS